MRSLIPLSIALLALALPAIAAEDKATGLVVELPEAEFIIEPSTLTGQYTANFGVNTVSGEPSLIGGKYLCEVGFQPGPQNADLTQDEINATLAAPEWVAMAQGRMSSIFEFDGTEQFELAGATGYQFIAIPKQAGAEDVRVVLTMIETPKGRTAISCATNEQQLDQALPVFRTIRQGVTPPA